MPYSPIYNDASLMLLDDMLEEYNSEECTDGRRDELESLMLGLSEQKEQRMDNLYKAYRNAEFESSGLKPIIDSWTQRKSNADKRMKTAKRLLEFLKGKQEKVSLLCGGELTQRKSTVTVVGEGLPSEYRKPGEPMLTEIKKAIQSGIEVPGAWLETKYNIQIK